ncbi:type II toxin-antitoxin system YhaV family toxin [Desulfovibrio sp. JC010]|uniref:type II toxin-antitoxin system YhaV family toxin n=1 Tax=Desulfovibrio sp. JC010 TaxID=2593641 RepID=UPI0013D06AE7|nr:type II toxin-antitoxin system YhaV family toxin [Desulfovibrio sp. JC010]NDV25527.1 type II toxin-antitoxin system YhaV family toxin [Desulfovibrio sp. JC010]
MGEWKIFLYHLFKLRYEYLFNEVKRLKAKDPDSYKEHKTTKMFASVVKCIALLKKDPTGDEYQMGVKVLSGFRYWRRVKRHLPQRHRLFFRFRSDQTSVVLAWLNDDKTLRKEGAKTDVYHVFFKMLESGKVPDRYEELLESSEEYGASSQKSISAQS